MSARRFLVTAALPYANGRLHVGHIAGAYLPADIYVRYLRSRGDEVGFICGSDDHGVPILLTAQKEGMTPREVVEAYHAGHERDFRGLGIEFDVYGQTMSQTHHRMSQEFFRKVHEAGYLVKKTSEQLYDPEKEIFLPDRYVRGRCHHEGCDNPGALGDQCERCGRTIDPLQLIDPVSVVSGTHPEVRSTVHWYFRLPAVAERLTEWIEGHPEWRPQVRNFALGLIQDGLPERAMTRDLSWGVPVPLDEPEAEGKVLYVWFDAPIGYISFTAQWCEAQGGSTEDYERWWKDPDTKIVHFLGEDNTVFHAVIWPGMLMAEGTYQLPEQVVANSFLNIQFPGEDEVKQSKSRDTAVWVEDFLLEHDPDPLRYYLTIIAPENQRTAYRPEEFVSRNNDELVAALGNFIHRTLTFAHKYLDGRVPEVDSFDDADEAQLASLASLPERVGQEIEAMRFKNALSTLMAEARQANRYLDAQAPWKSRKTDPPACARTVRVCLQTVRALAIVMTPLLPFAAEKVRRMLGLETAEFSWNHAADPLPGGAALGEAELLFKKIETEE